MPVKGTVSATCAALGPVARQPATPHQTPIPSADRSHAVTAPPSPERCRAGSRQAVLDLLVRPALPDLAPARNLRHLARRGRLPLLGQHHVSPSLPPTTKFSSAASLTSPSDLHEKPELLAVCLNEVWSWDITKLKGPAKWTYFYLYVIIDIFSRRVASSRMGPMPKALACSRHCSTTPSPSITSPGQLTLHADRGSPMKAKRDRVPACRSRRHQIAQPAAYLKRQSVLGKSLQDPEISANFSVLLWLHGGC